MGRFRYSRFAAVAAVLLLATTPARAAEKFTIGWSIYVGWMPWGYAAEQGIIQKWADKYGIEIEVEAEVETTERGPQIVPVRARHDDESAPSGESNGGGSETSTNESKTRHGS